MAPTDLVSSLETGASSVCLVIPFTSGFIDFVPPVHLDSEVTIEVETDQWDANRHQSNRVPAGKRRGMDLKGTAEKNSIVVTEGDSLSPMF